MTFVKTLFARWPLVVFCTAIFAIPTWLYCVYAPPVYESSVRLLIENKGLDIDEAGNVSGGGDKQFLATQAEILRSATIIRGSFQTVSHFDEVMLPNEQIANTLASLRATPLEGTEVLQITYQHEDPYYCVNRLRAVVESYASQSRVVEQVTTDESVSILEAERDSLLAQRRALEERRMELRRSTAVVGDGHDGLRIESTALQHLLDQKTLVDRAVFELSQALSASESPQDSLDMTLSLISSDDETTARTIREMRVAVANAIATEAAAVELYGDRNLQRLRASAERTAAEATLREAQLSIRGEARLRLERLRKQSKEIDQQVDDERLRLAAIGQDVIREQQLVKEIESIDQQFDVALAELRRKQLADSAIQAGSASVHIEPIDDFTVPQAPIWPLPIPLTGAAGLLGFLTAVFFIGWTQPVAASESQLPARQYSLEEIAAALRNGQVSEAQTYDDFSQFSVEAEQTPLPAVTHQANVSDTARSGHEAAPTAIPNAPR